MLFNRLAGILALSFGLVGVTGCAAGAYCVWLVWSRLDRANGKFFDAIDRGLGAVQDRVPVVQQRVQDAKFTTAAVTDAVRGWAGYTRSAPRGTRVAPAGGVGRARGRLAAAWRGWDA